MRCYGCKQSISSVAQQKMVAEYEQPDGTMKTFGPLCEDGPLKKATGKLVHVWHFKHYQNARKREARGGDSITGRMLGTDIPTAYDITKLAVNKDDLEQLGLSKDAAREETTAKFAERATQIREQAKSAGAAVEAIAERERRIAIERGGPYNHQHVGPVDRHRLQAHLLWAHAVVPFDPESLPEYSKLRQRHNEAHAKLALEEKEAERLDDPGYEPPVIRDWREQFEVDV